MWVSRPVTTVWDRLGVIREEVVGAGYFFWSHGLIQASNQGAYSHALTRMLRGVLIHLRGDGVSTLTDLLGKWVPDHVFNKMIMNHSSHYPA